MNKLQQIFLDNYEEIILTLRLRDCERENIPESVKFIFDNRLEVLQISHLPTLHIGVTASPAG